MPTTEGQRSFRNEPPQPCGVSGVRPQCSGLAARERTYVEVAKAKRRRCRHYQAQQGFVSEMHGTRTI